MHPPWGWGVGVREFKDFLHLQTSNLASKFVEETSLGIKMISLQNGQLVWGCPLQICIQLSNFYRIEVCCPLLNACVYSCFMYVCLH